MNDNQLLRYSRQILLPQIDIEGQNRLAQAHVLIMGLGGLGCPAATYLAAAGVGRLTLADPDTVELTNLQRQFLYSADHQGAPKAQVAQAALRTLNPEIHVTSVCARLTGNELLHQVAQADVVLDATDNLDSRLAINAACQRAATVLVSAAATGLSGQLAVFDPNIPGAPCYRCLYDEATITALTCAESGILGPVVGTLGTLQALETIKLIAGLGSTLQGRLLVFDGATLDWQKLTLTADPHCPVCALRNAMPESES